MSNSLAATVRLRPDTGSFLLKEEERRAFTLAQVLARLSSSCFPYLPPPGPIISSSSFSDRFFSLFLLHLLSEGTILALHSPDGLILSVLLHRFLCLFCKNCQHVVNPSVTS